MNTDRETRAEREEAVKKIYPEAELTEQILKCAFAVHNTLGTGFLEKVYANALAIELRGNGHSCIQEEPLQVLYKNTIVGDFSADLIVEDQVPLELKACQALDPNHEAQILNYLRASGIRVGLLLNSDRPKLEYRRFVL